MPTVSDKYFLTITEQLPGTQHWVNLNGMKQEADEATAFYPSGFPSYTVNLRGMSLPILPPEIQITNIKIDVSAYFTGGGPSVGIYIGNVNIAGGTSYASNQLNKNTPTTKSFSGTPAWWGITDQQALDFILNGTQSLFFQAIENGGSVSFTTHVPWVRCTFTYRPLGVTMPAVF